MSPPLLCCLTTLAIEVSKEEARVAPAPAVVAMLPSPSMGHLIPMIEFTKRVVCYHNLAVSFMIPTVRAHPTPPNPSSTLDLSPRSINYLLREQRLLFILIDSTFFIIQPTLSCMGPPEPAHTGRVPIWIGGRRQRIIVTDGSSFIESHLIDKLIARGDDIIVIDNFFTGRKESLMHLFGNPRFELIRHDVTNVMGMLNMLGLAKRIGARFLLTSTSEVYGDSLEHPQKETYWGNVNPIGERSCYDEGKRTAETLAMDCHWGVGAENDNKRKSYWLWQNKVIPRIWLAKMISGKVKVLTQNKKF
ncbi:hypothetical protein AAZX31_12G133800 [Glycine max]